MRQWVMLLRGLGLASLVTLGCATMQPKLKPPKQEEVLDVPPESESRFSQALQYPKDTPKAAQIKRTGVNVPLTDPSRFASGGSPGMTGT